VAILDADKEGFLRSGGSLIQTSGRAARNLNGQVIMYAETVTQSMRQCLNETERRRAIQSAYNLEHGITPTSIVKAIDEVRASIEERDYLGVPDPGDRRPRFKSQGERMAYLNGLDAQMKQAAADLDFERAARLRDEIRNLRVADLGLATTSVER
jgi:excinuclease ABC subunit B